MRKAWSRVTTRNMTQTSTERTARMAELALLMPPDGLALLDGHILVSAAGVTLVIAAPAP